MNSCLMRTHRTRARDASVWLAEFLPRSQVALVTGGGTGLGRAIATTLSSLGATVIICSRKLDVLQSTAAAITAETKRPVIAVACDVRDPEAVARAVDEGVRRRGEPSSAAWRRSGVCRSGGTGRGVACRQCGLVGALFSLRWHPPFTLATRNRCSQVKAAGGKLPDIIVNNAAGNFVSPFERLSPNGWKT